MKVTQGARVFGAVVCAEAAGQEKINLRIALRRTLRDFH